MRGKRQAKRLGILMLISMLTFTSVYTIFASEIKDAQIEKSNLEKKKKETEDKIKSLEKQKGNIVVYIEKMDKQLNELNTEIDSLTKKIDKASKDLSKTKKELKEAKKTEKNQYETMKKRIKYMYENGSTNYIEIILGAANMSDMLNRAEYIEKIMEYDRNMLKKYQETKQGISDTKKSIEAKIAELEEMNEEVSYEKQTVEKLIDDKSKEVAKYNQNIKDSKVTASGYANAIEEQEQKIEQLLEAERKRIEAEERRKEEERKRKEEERKRREEEQKKQQNNTTNNNSNSNNNQNNNNNTNTQPNTPAPQGGFTWPVPSSHKITSYFGYRDQPTNGASTNHQGIDISAPTGSAIVAAKGGTVVTASYGAGSGNYIMISHGNGVFTVYMHCSQLLVSVGQTVSSGEKIALVGSTGISTGPHLHFAVSANGKYVNPLGYVK